MDKILFSRNLQLARKAKYKTQQQFAEAYNATYQTGDKDFYGSVKKYESGKEMPNLERAVNMCDLLDVDIDYLLDRIERPTHADEVIYRKTGLNPDAIRDITPNSQFSGFINYLASEGLIEKIENLILEAGVADVFDTPERRERLKDLMNTNDPDAVKMRQYLNFAIGADFISMAERRRLRIEELLRIIERSLEEYVHCKGELARTKLEESRNKETASGDGNAESGKQGR